MSDRVEVFDVAVPAAGLRTTLWVTPTHFPAGRLDRVDVVIPAGVAGLAGFQIGYGNQAVIPATVGAFIRGNDEVWSTALTNQPTGGGWSLIAYNTDLYVHTFQVRFYVTELTDPAPPVVLPEPIGTTDVVPDSEPVVDQ